MGGLSMKGSLSIQDVTLTYGKGEKSVLALDGISFEVKPNEFTVIVGPSGCGKSSLLYIGQHPGLRQACRGAWW
jgi:NitT/TauT family transport system ATP-binding protein